uniref:MobA protein n=1 Tax=Halomonas elongata TaxID=2746 RepID=Q9K591_HALEL|nr:MobA protein [Halomonas elongata]
MIVKFHARGTGGGSGPVGYLLGRDRDREAPGLRGDPDQTEALIDASQYAKAGYSGVLSFAETGVSEAAKREIMDDFERTLMPGLDADQYDCLWVEHRDKGRLELNFVIPNTELTSGKRLQPYYDRADRPRVDAWQTLTNERYALHDPNDPANQRALTTPANLPRDKQQAHGQITDGLLTLGRTGEVTDRAGVVLLEGAGFEVTRQTKTSISIADPDGGKPMRLRGKLYERDVSVGDSLRGEIERASREYREGRQERVREARERLAVGLERKREENQRRYPRPEPELASGRAKELDGRDHSDNRELGAGLGGHGDDGLVHHRPDQRDRQPQRDARAVEERGRRDPVEPLRREPEVVREDRRERRSVRRGQDIPGAGGVLDDRPGARTVERLRELTGRLREAASGMAERLRELQGMFGPRSATTRAERPGDALEQAGQRLEREGRALDARGKEVASLKDRERRGRGFGLDR